MGMYVKMMNLAVEVISAVLKIVHICVGLPVGVINTWKMPKRIVVVLSKFAINRKIDF
jgi:hypothetical protein